MNRVESYLYQFPSKKLTFTGGNAFLPTMLYVSSNMKLTFSLPSDLALVELHGICANC